MAKKSQTRVERLAAALRANLKRRKQDARTRNRPAPMQVAPPPPDGPKMAKKTD